MRGLHPLLGLIVAVAACSAFADTDTCPAGQHVGTASYWYSQSYQPTASPGLGSTSVAACQALVGKMNQGNTTYVYSYNSTDAAVTDGSGTHAICHFTQKYYSSGAVASSDYQSGVYKNAAVCVAGAAGPTCGTTTTNIDLEVPGYVGGRSSVAFCSPAAGFPGQGCLVNGNIDAAGGSPATPGGSDPSGWTHFGSLTGSGTVCTTGQTGGPPGVPSNDPSTKPPAADGQGKCFGQFNGATIAVNCGETHTNTPGTQVGKPNPGLAPANGTDVSATNTTTDCKGTSCTTTTTITVTHSDGTSNSQVTKTTVDTGTGQGTSTSTLSSATASGTVTQGATTSATGDAAAVCSFDTASGGKAKGCNGSGGGGGGNGTGAGDSGGAAPCATGTDAPVDTCSGDAIMCAQLQEANMARCAEQKRFDDLTGQGYTGLGTAVLAGNDPAASTLPSQANGSNVDLSALPLDQSGWMGGGCCPSDVSVVMPYGQHFSLGFEELCDGTVVYPLRALMLVIGSVASLATLRRALTS